MDAVSFRPPAAVSGFASLLLAYVIGMAALATLWPLNFQLQPLRIVVESSFEDVVLNLGLLFPAGFLWRLAYPVRRAPKCLDVLFLGVAFSALLEGLQLFLPTRSASPTDIVLNGFGAWAGAWICADMKHRYQRSWLDRVFLALPLTKLVYLTVPLIAMEAWSAHATGKIVGVMVLAPFVATIAAALHLRIKREAGATGGLQSVIFAFGFGSSFLLPTVPLWSRALATVSTLYLGAIAVCLLALLLERWRLDRERRFELAVVRRALPWFGVYLALAAWQPLGGLIPALGGSARGLLLLRDVAAFSVLGYMLSQLHARGLVEVWRSRTALWLVVATAVFGAIRAWGGVTDVAELVLLLGAGALGSVIHRAELAAVRAFRAPSTDRPSSPAQGSGTAGEFPTSLPHSR